METKDLIANLREWHENLISELCADDVLTCDDLCGYPGPCIVIQAANLLEAQQKRIAELEAALREQEERERGCEYCNEDSEGYRKMIGAFSITNPFHGNVWNIETCHCKPRQIYFCPMCGRRLSQQPKEDSL